VDHLWEDVAEAWFKPDGAAPTFMFRVSRDRLEAADRPVTIGRLLAAAALAADEVESWRLDDDTPLGPNDPLPLPPDAAHLTVYVRLKPPAVSDDGPAVDLSPEQWQALDALWKTILGLEAAIDTMRISLEGLRSEMDAAFKQPMSVEDKVHALQSDVAQWTKAKSRVHYALPKVREFIHRATWATAGPERKALDELVKDVVEPRKPHPQLNHIRERFDHLLKDRQVLFGQGTTVGQECRAIAAEIHRALSTLQRNAADRARKEREARRVKGKYL
jgi:hypothetical protein